MRRSTTPLVLIGLTFGLVIYFSINSSQKKVEQKTLLSIEKSSIGSKEDPEARARFEFRRLRNPQTGKIPRNIRTKELEFAKSLPTREAFDSIKNDRNRVLFKNPAWTSRGPVNVGGRTRALAHDVTNENILIAGGVSGGLWRSTDGGGSWTKTTNPSQLHTITAIAQDTRSGKTSTWYASTGEFSGSAAFHSGTFFQGDGIYKSTDGGNTWSALPNTVSDTPGILDSPFDYTFRVITDASNSASDIVYAATFGGIYRSNDGGNSWVRGLGDFSNEAPQFTDIVITSNGILYATMSEATLSGNAGPKGLYRSTDGTTWNEITAAGWPSTYRRIVIGIAPSNENIVYFVGETPGSGLNDHSFWKYTYLSGDGSGAGGTWEDRSANLPAEGDPVGDFDTQGSYDLLVNVHPSDENTVFIGGTNLYRSTDGFATGNNTKWVGGYSPANDISQYANHHPDQHSLIFSPSNPNGMYSAHDGGLSKTNNNMADSIAWIPLNNGYITSQFYTLAIDQTSSGSNKIYGGMQDNGTYFTNSTSSSTPWNNVFSGDGSFCAIQNGGNTALLSVQEGKVFMGTIQSSGNIGPFVRVDPDGGSGYLFITPFILDPNDSNIMYLAVDDRVWRNSDLSGIPLNFDQDPTSINWFELTNSAVGGESVTALGVSDSPPNRLYYGTGSGQVFRLDDAHTGNPIRTDIWTGKNLPVDSYINCIAVNPDNADEALLVFSNYAIISIFQTDNGGDSWTPASGNLEENPDGSGNGPAVLWVDMLSGAGSSLFFAATSTGLYSTTNLNGSATVWTQEGASTIGNVIVDMVKARAVDGLVVTATHGNGVYSNIFAPSVKAGDSALPETFVLHQNYPNPFNPSTTIAFFLARDSQTSIKVFNIQGKKITALLNEHRKSGSHTIIWDGKDQNGREVASGIYYYRLETPFNIATQKMTLLR
ncbi:MAG: T9SS type A sorting domain-containing protein [Caldithrix sp.]|nr:MAG: T9SS type A sorting domain-containing protein [Caldithrix sp.]